MRTVLIIEEHPNLRRLYTHVLSDRGYNVLTAWHPRQAEEKIKLGEPDLILVDPPTRGNDEKRSWRQVLSRGDLPPLLFNVGSRQMDAGWSERPGSYFVQKSSDVSQLLHTVEEVLSSEDNRRRTRVRKATPDC